MSYSSLVPPGTTRIINLRNAGASVLPDPSLKMAHGRQWDGVPRKSGTRPIIKAQIDFLNTFGEAEIEEIIERWACGERVRDITNALGVGTAAFYSWKKYHPAVDNAWNEAKEYRAQNYADEALEASDAPAGRDENGRILHPTPEDVQHGHLRVKVKMWLAAHMSPSAYGKQGDTQVNLTVLALQAAKEVNAVDTRRRMAKLTPAKPEPLPAEVVPAEVVPAGDDEESLESLL